MAKSSQEAAKVSMSKVPTTLFGDAAGELVRLQDPPGNFPHDRTIAMGRSDMATTQLNCSTTAKTLSAEEQRMMWQVRERMHSVVCHSMQQMNVDLTLVYIHVKLQDARMYETDVLLICTEKWHQHCCDTVSTEVSHHTQSIQTSQWHQIDSHIHECQHQAQRMPQLKAIGHSAWLQSCFLYIGMLIQHGCYLLLGVTGFYPHGPMEHFGKCVYMISAMVKPYHRVDLKCPPSEAG